MQELEQEKADKENAMIVSAFWVTYASDRDVMSNKQSITLEGSTKGRKLPKKPEKWEYGEENLQMDISSMHWLDLTAGTVQTCRQAYEQAFMPSVTAYYE